LWIFAFAGICGTILCAVAALIGHLRARNGIIS
jgi:hypothetical protein